MPSIDWNWKSCASKIFARRSSAPYISMCGGAVGTGDNFWFTPAKYIRLARQVLGEIDLDPASHELAQRQIKAKRFHTPEDDGLKHEWHGRVWLNPFFGHPHIEHFTDKLIAEYHAGRVTEAILLTQNYTDTA
jgi:hypothetical protein